MRRRYDCSRQILNVTVIGRSWPAAARCGRAPIFSTRVTRAVRARSLDHPGSGTWATGARSDHSRARRPLPGGQAAERIGSAPCPHQSLQSRFSRGEPLLHLFLVAVAGKIQAGGAVHEVSCLRRCGSAGAAFLRVVRRAARKGVRRVWCNEPARRALLRRLRDAICRS